MQRQTTWRRPEAVSQPRADPARPVSVAGRLTRWSRRNPALAGVIATLALVISLAFVVVVGQWREAVYQRGSSPRKSNHSAAATW